MPPTEKVINANEKLVMRAVCSINVFGITCIISGFRRIPARMYPVTFGNLRRVHISPRINPVKMMMPTIRIGSIEQIS